MQQTVLGLVPFICRSQSQVIVKPAKDLLPIEGEYVIIGF